MQEVNVRVAVRVRPLLPKERIGGDQMCVQVHPKHNQLIVGKDKVFTFDHVLNCKTSQEEVYQTCVEPLVTSIFDGYNATVFAYGQTGSGKTYTIGGCNVSSMTEEEYGVIPRAIKHMFDIMQSKENVEFRVKVSYIEIYKEELQDLLDVDTSSKDLHVREDDQGNTVISGTKEVDCETLDEVMSLLDSGSAARHTGSTQMNEHSSRSHSIFTIVIGQKWTEDDVLASRRSRKTSDSSENFENDGSMEHTVSGKFHFVDLAGSERAHRTGNVGDRFKESIHINTGLLSLGNVISALGDPKKKSTHIPYRESKITRLLKDSLGGNARTLMICCISPATTNFDESLNALKYANRAKNIKNKPIVNRDVQSIRFEEMQSEIRALREELIRQRTTVFSAGRDTNLDLPVYDEDHVQDLEDKIIKLQTECSHYRVVSEEAYKQLIEIKDRDLLSKSQDLRLRDWLDLMEEIKNKVPATLSRENLDNQTIRDLQSELKKCRDDLRSDEDIFAEKTREVNHLSEKIEELEKGAEESGSALFVALERCEKQEQQLLQQQLKIEELQRTLKPDIHVIEHEEQDSPLFQKKHTHPRDALLGDSYVLDSTAVTSSAPPGTGRRPKSVPIHVNRRQDQFYSNLRPPSRNIKTSPALFSLDRVMQSFRARSQLLVSRLEDSDEVLHQTFSDEQEDAPSAPTEFVRRGTFRVKKNRRRGSLDKDNQQSVEDLPSVRTSQPVREVRSSTRVMTSVELSQSDASSSRLINIDPRSSTEIHRKKIKQAQLKVLEANQKMRDLAINIRMKEQLIRELVKSEKDAELMNKQYAEKIKALEKEKLSVKQELMGTQKALHDLGAKEHQETVEKNKLQSEYKKKIEEAKTKMSALQRKQRETEKIASFASQHEKKIQDMEFAVDRMKQQYDNLQRRFKDETEQKAKLERDMQKELQRVKELELKSQQQQKILKRKNEEIAAAQRRLRSGSLPPLQMENLEKLEEQKRWVDTEIEKVLSLRRQNEELQEELNRRESIIAKKEAMLSEKGELEIKKLRSSQMLSHDAVTVSLKLENVQKKLEEKKRELAQTTEDEQENVRHEISQLKRSRDKLQKTRAAMDEKLAEGNILSGEEERRLIEIDEAIEALDAAIEYKNDSIHVREVEIRNSQIMAQSDDNLMNRLKSLSTTETKSLLSKYFDKVINLREEERRMTLQCDGMEVKIDEQERIIRELEGALQRTNMDLDRRLVQQQREYEQKIQLLMHQLAQGAAGNGHGDGNGGEAKTHQLEKELYYYKKTSRDLKKKVKELISKGVISSQVFEDIGVHNSIQSLADNDGMTPRTQAPTPRDQTSHRESQSRPSSGRERPPSRPLSGRSVHKSSQDQPAAATPVKISRKDLRPMTEEEVLMRRSNLSRSVASPQPQDSLDGGGNPW